MFSKKQSETRKLFLSFTNEPKIFRTIGIEFTDSITEAVKKYSSGVPFPLKVHKNENFFGFDFKFCTISLLIMHK